MGISFSKTLGCFNTSAMNLKEYEGKALFEQYGLTIPHGVLVKEKNDTGLKTFLRNSAANNFVVKAQLPSGSRGKRGGVVFASRKNLAEKIRKLLMKRIGREQVMEVLVEGKIDIAHEYYLSIAIDRFRKCPVLIFSHMGGIDIEEIARRHPEKIYKIFCKEKDNGDHVIGEMFQFVEKKISHYLKNLKIEKQTVQQILEILKKLWNLFQREDALLTEINPLIVDRKGKIFAVDAKIIIDDNALNRHPNFAQQFLRTQSTLEKTARKAGLAYVELKGNLAIIGNGAGLVMATLDAVYDNGGKPANFCDVGGGASIEMMERALQVVLQKKTVKGIFINIFGGITHCDEIAKGLIHYVKKYTLTLPMVVRMVGTNQKKAEKILQGSGITRVHSFDEAARIAASLL